MTSFADAVKPIEPTGEAPPIELAKPEAEEEVAA